MLTALDTGRAEGDGPLGQADKPMPREQPRSHACSAGRHVQPGPIWQALEDIGTEAVSALTVIESRFHFMAEDGSSEQLLSGFQVGPESCTAQTNLFRRPQ